MKKKFDFEISLLLPSFFGKVLATPLRWGKIGIGPCLIRKAAQKAGFCSSAISPRFLMKNHAYSYNFDEYNIVYQIIIIATIIINE